jgi:hypothetical protein
MPAIHLGRAPISCDNGAADTTGHATAPRDAFPRHWSAVRLKRTDLSELAGAIFTAIAASLGALDHSRQWQFAAIR